MPLNARLNRAPVKAPASKPTVAQRRWLKRGLTQPGGKLPIFDENGQRFSNATIRSCVRQGWAEPWFDNPLQPDWVVCKLTHLGRVVAEEDLWEADERPDLTA